MTGTDAVRALESVRAEVEKAGFLGGPDLAACVNTMAAALASQPRVDAGAVYQWREHLSWNDMSKDEYDSVHANPGNFVRGETIIYPHMTRVLYAASPTPSGNAALVAKIEHALHDCYMEHPDSRLTTTMLHDLAVAAVAALAKGATP